MQGSPGALHEVQYDSFRSRVARVLWLRFFDFMCAALVVYRRKTNAGRVFLLIPVPQISILTVSRLLRYVSFTQPSPLSALRPSTVHMLPHPRRVATYPLSIPIPTPVQCTAWPVNGSSHFPFFLLVCSTCLVGALCSCVAPFGIQLPVPLLMYRDEDFVPHHSDQLTVVMYLDSWADKANAVRNRRLPATL